MRCLLYAQTDLVRRIGAAEEGEARVKGWWLIDQVKEREGRIRTLWAERTRHYLVKAAMLVGWDACGGNVWVARKMGRDRL